MFRNVFHTRRWDDQGPRGKQWNPGKQARASQCSAPYRHTHINGSPLTTERPLTPSGRPPGSPHTARLASWARHPVLASQVCWPQRLQDSKTDSEPRKILGHINRKSWAGDQLGYLDQNSFSSLRPSFSQSVRQNTCKKKKTYNFSLFF